MKFTSTLIKGKLIKRYKRFFVDIKVNNEIITAHCPNTGSMLGLLDKGNEVWVTKVDDPNRKLNKLQKTVRVKSSDSTIHNFNYSPVPYDIQFSLYSFTATAENGLQIIEQILPYFQPDYTVTINAIPELNIKRDVPIILDSVDYEDTYDGDFNKRRAVIYTLNFTAKTYLYGPMAQSKIIRKTQADMMSDTDTINKAREERIIVIPNPEDANADDDFGFTTKISFYDDTKKYNPVTGEDE